LATAVTAAAKAAKDRIAAIMALDAAKTRATLAQHLAMHTDMTPEAAKGVLEASPEAVAKETVPKPNERKTAEVLDDGTKPAADYGWNDVIAKTNARNGFVARA
jgi:hypothetical protein